MKYPPEKNYIFYFTNVECSTNKYIKCKKSDRKYAVDTGCGYPL